jgi:hypothetical protein
LGFGLLSRSGGFGARKTTWRKLEPWSLCSSSISLFHRYFVVGRFSVRPATEALEEALAIHRQADNKWGMGFVLHTVGYAALQQGDLSRARTALEESLVLSEQFGHVPGIAWSLEGLVHVAAGCGEGRRTHATARDSNPRGCRVSCSRSPGSE